MFGAGCRIQRTTTQKAQKGRKEIEIGEPAPTIIIPRLGFRPLIGEMKRTAWGWTYETTQPQLPQMVVDLQTWN